MKIKERKYKIETTENEIGYCWGTRKPETGQKRYTNHVVYVDAQGRSIKEPRLIAKLSYIKHVYAIEPTTNN